MQCVADSNPMRLPSLNASPLISRYVVDVVQSGAVCGSVLQCVAVCCSVYPDEAALHDCLPLDHHVLLSLALSHSLPCPPSLFLAHLYIYLHIYIHAYISYTDVCTHTNTHTMQESTRGRDDSYTVCCSVLQCVVVC